MKTIQMLQTEIDNQTLIMNDLQIKFNNHPNKTTATNLSNARVELEKTKKDLLNHPEKVVFCAKAFKENMQEYFSVLAMASMFDK